VFRTYGHDIIFLRDWLPTDSPDQLVAAVSENEGAVLVTVDGIFVSMSRLVFQLVRELDSENSVTYGWNAQNLKRPIV
jgi:hypothetical protein